MTLQERIAAVMALGFGARHAEFIVAVALHSGFCARRQYEVFANVQYGKNVRDFLDGIVSRGLAARFSLRANRGYIYHLKSRMIYRAIGEEHNRNRRDATPAQIARKLMVLDYVLSHRDVSWHATEKDKVELLTGMGVLPTDLPGRVFTSGAIGDHTARYFLEKLPIGIAQDSSLQFVFLSVDGRAPAFWSFLRGHARLFDALPAWRVIVVGPRCWTKLETVFRQFCEGSGKDAGREAELRWYFERRALIDAGDLAEISVNDLRRFRELRERFARPDVEARYARWIGEPRGDALPGEVKTRSNGTVAIEALPFPYEQFGTFPGVY
jgi:hypothetical protein